MRSLEWALIQCDRVLVKRGNADMEVETGTRRECRGKNAALRSEPKELPESKKEARNGSFAGAFRRRMAVPTPRPQLLASGTDRNENLRLFKPLGACHSVGADLGN